MKTLSALAMGFDRDFRLAEPSAYSLIGGPPVTNPLDAEPEEVEEPAYILYKTEDHGESWKPVGRFTLKRRGYTLSWEAVQAPPPDPSGRVLVKLDGFDNLMTLHGSSLPVDCKD